MFKKKLREEDIKKMNEKMLKKIGFATTGRKAFLNICSRGFGKTTQIKQRLNYLNELNKTTKLCVLLVVGNDSLNFLLDGLEMGEWIKVVTKDKLTEVTMDEFFDFIFIDDYECLNFSEKKYINDIFFREDLTLMIAWTTPRISLNKKVILYATLNDHERANKNDREQLLAGIPNSEEQLSFLQNDLYIKEWCTKIVNGYHETPYSDNVRNLKDYKNKMSEVDFRREVLLEFLIEK